MLELVSENDEALMEKYVQNQEPDEAELRKAMELGGSMLASLRDRLRRRGTDAQPGSPPRP